VHTPRELEELPYFAHLEAEEQPPAPGADYDTVLFSDATWPDERAGNVRFIESAFCSVNFGEGELRRSRFNDVWLRGCQLNGTDLAETNWLDTEIGTSVLAGTALWDAQWVRVTLFGCKLVGTNLRGATLREVAFVNCTLRDVDFGDAKLTEVTFPGSTITGLRFDQAKASKVDFREATELDIHSGYDALRGTRITMNQLLDLAPEFAQALGVKVD
jgi:uncharacterized protein YjbI with pentapeptide repeats